MTKQQKLEQIRVEITENNVCPNLAQTATQLVLGDGNPNADVMFIGEAPGAKEDEQGLPFVGAAGKFLDEMLDSIGMNRCPPRRACMSHACETRGRLTRYRLHCDL